MKFLIIVALVILAVIIFKIISGIRNNVNTKHRENALLAKAEQGDANAQYELACHCRSKGNSDDAIRWYKQSAEIGYAQAQLALGLLYKEGEIIEKNLTQAVDWFKKAADQGLSEAHYELIGRENNIAYGIAALEKAADLQDANAMYYLGLCYMRGNGVLENKDQAVELLEKAVANGSTNAEQAVGFKEIEQHSNFKYPNYTLIKDIQYDLVKAGYILSGSVCDNQTAFVSVKDKSKEIGNISLHAKPKKASVVEIDGNNWTRKHEMAIMDNAHGFNIYSTISTEPKQFPEWLKICARIIKAHNIQGKRSNTIFEYPSNEYINSVLN